MSTNITNGTGTGRGIGLLARQERAWVSGGSTVVLIVGAVVRSVGLLVRGRVRRGLTPDPGHGLCGLPQGS